MQVYFIDEAYCHPSETGHYLVVWGKDPKDYAIDKMSYDAELNKWNVTKSNQVTEIKTVVAWAKLPTVEEIENDYDVPRELRTMKGLTDNDEETVDR